MNQKSKTGDKSDAIISNSEQSSDVGQVHDKSENWWTRILTFLEVQKSTREETIKETFH